MRFIVLGAGAVGCVVGGRLAQHRESVVLVARGAHFEAIRDRGLRLESSEGAETLRVPVVDRIDSIVWASGDVLLLATKTQDSEAALARLVEVAPQALPIFCLQNSVANELLASARFPHVYGVFVWSPADYLQPGIVRVWSSPKSGILHVGRYPSGVDPLAASTASAFRRASFHAEAKSGIMRWKHRKLLSNLSNAVNALCGAAAGVGQLAQLARQEALACFEAAGISFVADDEEDAAELERTVRAQVIDGVERPGGSTWQSLARQLGSVETDYLNGEIVRLGQRHGIATPVNVLLCELTHRMAVQRRPPGSVSPREILSALGVPSA